MTKRDLRSTAPPSNSRGGDESNSSSEIVSALVCKCLGVSSDRLSRGASLVDDLGADSLTLVALALALEERFGITIANEDTINLRTVEDVIACVDASRALLGDEKNEPGR